MATTATVTNLASASLFFMCTWLVAIVGAHLRPTGYNFLQNAVSDFGSHPASRPFAWAQWLSMSTAAALQTAAGFLLLNANPELSGLSALAKAKSGLTALGVFAGARFAIIFFPNLVRENPPPGQERTDFRVFLTIVHLLLAVVAFASLPAASIQIAEGVQAAGPLAGLPVYQQSDVLLGLGWTTLGGLVFMVATIWLRRFDGPKVFGLGERVYYVTMALWLFAFGALLSQS